MLLAPSMIPESLESLEPYRFDGRSARVLGLPLRAVTPTARLVANRTEWLCGSIPPRGWRSGGDRTGSTAFPPASLEEALDCVERWAVK